AAPVPVPPPMPVVMKTMSAPCRASAMRSRSSSAAWRPTSGLVPAPRPLVTLRPSCRMVRACTFFSAWASVLAQMNSTPSILLRTIWLTALPPPPPTPMTLMTALGVTLSTISNIIPLLSRLLSPTATTDSEVALEPPLHSCQDRNTGLFVVHARARHDEAFGLFFQAVQQQAHAC